MIAMKKTLLAALACAGWPLLAAANDAPWLADARGVAMSVPPRLLEVLQTEINKGGPEGAIAVCRDESPKMAAAASARTGWQIRRVSLRNRNPRAVPDAWEEAALRDFDRRAAAGESPATLERAETVTVDGQPMQRYIRALPVQQLCVSCHGPADQLGPAVTAQLRTHYPDDRGVGYSVGQIRGAITIRRPQP